MKNITCYASDLTDAEWEWLEPHVPQPKPGGRPVKHPRRLVRDYEVRTDHSEAFIYLVMIRIMLRRLANS